MELEAVAGLEPRAGDTTQVYLAEIDQLGDFTRGKIIAYGAEPIAGSLTIGGLVTDRLGFAYLGGGVTGALAGDESPSDEDMSAVFLMRTGWGPAGAVAAPQHVALCGLPLPIGPKLRAGPRGLVVGGPFCGLDVAFPGGPRISSKGGIDIFVWWPSAFAD